MNTIPHPPPTNTSKRPAPVLLVILDRDEHYAKTLIFAILRFSMQFTFKTTNSMPRFITLFFIGAAMAIMPSCKKTARFELTLTGFRYDANYPSNCWVIFHEAGGKVLDVQRFYPTPDVHDYHFSTDALDAMDTCYLTVARLQLSNGFLSLWTIPNIGPGQHPLVQYLNVSPNCSICDKVTCGLTIRNTPEIDYLSCGSGEKVLFSIEPPDLQASVGASSGGSGIALALKAKNEADPRFYWLPDNGSNFLIATLDYNDFSPDWLVSDFSFPFQSKWQYTVSGVTKEENNPVFGYLSIKEAKNGDPLTNHFSIRRPGQVPFVSLWVSALDTETGNYYEKSVSVDNAYAFPDVPFRAKNLDFSNSAYVTCSTEGDFDALQIYLFGDTGKTFWTIEGPAADLKTITMPQVPDSLVQQWPKLNAFSIGYTICGEIDGVDGFAGLSLLDPEVVFASSYWRAKRGYRANFKTWY